MCGIYLTNIAYKKEEVGQKLETIAYRGPDHLGIVNKGPLTFGHLRLAIIDLDTRSNQPFDRGDLTIVFNGEIYNYRDIRSELIAKGHSFQTESDTEVILAGYQEWGKAMVPKLNGMFAFAIYDSAKSTVFCARDRFGVKPFYYYWRAGKFEICSQIRPISMDKDLEINYEAIGMYLDCTYIPSPFSIYKEVHKLSPGNCLLIDLQKESYVLEEYWNLTSVPETSLSFEEAKDQLHALLKDAVAIRLQADVPYGCFLSGGIDSSLVSALASRINYTPIRTFSVGFDDPVFDESKVAAQFAQILGSNHTEISCKVEDVLQMLPEFIKVFDEPFGDSSALPSLLLNKVTKNHVTMALSGDGGDESFLGYNHYDWVNTFTPVLRVPYVVRKALSIFAIKNVFGKNTQPLKRVLSLKSENDFIAGIFLGYNSLLKVRDLSWFKAYSDSLKWAKNIYQKTADLNIKLWLENDSNVKVDRASMAFSVEVRSPFLDYRIVEFARTLPVSFRYQKGKKKRILREILKEYIPEEVFNLPKRGFAVPLGKWINGELKEEFDKTLNEAFLGMLPNFDLEKFKLMREQHRRKIKDNSSYIWRVYVLAKWFEEFGSYRKSG